ncbi:hypothetical protein ACQP2E_19790 [Actinoplanes sp. CA-015351]|uniref:hypothetical protein n=1 Tax=Actinoplanes sp. CA-015351 TaxID=3239897 RepID=UPI003D96A5E6
MLTLNVVRALANLVVSIDVRQIPEPVRSDLLNDAAGALGDLTDAETGELVALLRQVAEEEPDPERRTALTALPETLGFVVAE